MAAKEKTAGPGRVKTWWKGLKSEFSKITWPTRGTIVSQTIVVIIITIIVGILISIIDNIVQFGLDKIIG